MAREPSAHYKAIASEVEMFRKRESSNMKRIKALEDKVDFLMSALKSGDMPAPKESGAASKPGKNEYRLLNDEVKKSNPELVPIWDVKEKYGFASQKTVENIFSRLCNKERHSGEFNGVRITSDYVNETEADEAIKIAIESAIVCIEYDEMGVFKESSLKSDYAVRFGTSGPGKFRLPEKAPKDWIISIAESEALRECSTRKGYDMFIEGFADTYGRALAMDTKDTRKLIDSLIHSGKILRDGNTIKAA